MVMNNKRRIVAFDFDGTITKKDSFIEFIRFAHGDWPFIKGVLKNSIMLAAYALHIYPNWKAKQKLFSYFFKEMPMSEFDVVGEQFINSRACSFFKKPAIDAIEQHKRAGDTIVIISASPENWIIPFAKKHGINYVIGTQLDVDLHNNLTGSFLTKNCYGKEKVTRLLQLFPDRNEYILIAYGDSRGDKELLRFADKAFYREFPTHEEYEK